MVRTFITTVVAGLILNTPALAVDGVSTVEACGCTVSHAHGMLPRTLDEDDPWVLFLANRGRQLYLGIEVFEYDEFGNGSLASSLTGYLLRKDFRQKEPLSYRTIAGREAAFFEFTVRDEGFTFRRQQYAIDAGDRLIIVSVFGGNKLWYDNADRVDDLLATMTIVGSSDTGERLGRDIPLLPGTLMQARSEHTTQTTPPRFQRVLERAEPDIPYKRVMYDSELGEMVMYRSELPPEGTNAPVVVWLPNVLVSNPDSRVWEETGEDAMSAEAFRQAGFVVVVPTFRGMATNPGEHEFLYGEVDDLLAAIEATKTMRGVDPDRVYLAGHGIGATLGLLATTAGAPVRATFTFNANPWLFPTMAAGGFNRQPWEVTDTRSAELRSPIHWADDLSAPVVQVAGSGYIAAVSRRMQTMAAEAPHEMIVVNAPYEDLRDTLPSVRDVWVDLIRADVGPAFTADISETVLHEAAIRRYGRRVGIRRR